MPAPLNAYSNLLGPVRTRPAAASTPAAPIGQGAWDTGLGSLWQDGYQSSVASPSRATQLSTQLDANGLRQAISSVFQGGLSQDLVGANQVQSLNKWLTGLNEGQLATLRDQLNTASQPVEQVFALKALVAGESWENVQQYAAEMRGLPESEIIRRSTMRDDADVIQQWQDACGPATLQTLAGEADPRFAWELNKASDLASIDPAGAARQVAEQQKQWLEQYGGVAVERGRSGGMGMALGQILNDTMSSITKASYQTVEVTNFDRSLDDVSGLLKAGYDVPLRVEWSPPGAGPGYGHFILAMNVRGATGNREFQIHDPWTGKTAWIHEANIRNNSFTPIFESYARLTHTYEAQPQA